jgi:hypothetical protein
MVVFVLLSFFFWSGDGSIYKYYQDLTKRKMTKGQILPWPDQKENDKRTNTTIT